MKEIAWLTAEGKEMEEANWRDPGNHVLGMLLRSAATAVGRAPGSHPREDAWLLLLNGGGRSRGYALPGLREPSQWIEVLNTAHPVSQAPRADHISLSPRSLILLHRTG